MNPAATAKVGNGPLPIIWTPHPIELGRIEVLQVLDEHGNIDQDSNRHSTMPRC